MPLSDFVAPVIEVEISKTIYKMTLLTLRDHARAGREMMNGWAEPGKVVQELGKDISDAAQRILIETAYSENRRLKEPTLDEVFEWYRTPTGSLYKVWLSLQTHHPELDIDGVNLLMVQGEMEEASGSIEALPSGNSTVPATSGHNGAPATGHGAESIPT